MSDRIPPLIFAWDGEFMKPLHAKQADKYFVIGERYVLEEIQERSHKSHNHYFASVHDAWLNLPENMTEQFPTELHLRKRALIETGYCDERSIVLPTKAQAQRTAAFLKPMDDYAVIVARECTVIVFTAKSQSKRAMGAEIFQKSKTDVLDWVSNKIGVARAALERAAA